jgi:hypothetical protein
MTSSTTALSLGLDEKSGRLIRRSDLMPHILLQHNLAKEMAEGVDRRAGHCTRIAGLTKSHDAGPWQK